VLGGCTQDCCLDHWCLRTLLGIKWRQFVCNEEVRRITKQPNLAVIIQSWRLCIFGHIARMDDDADAKMILTAPLQRTGRDHQGYIVLDGDPASPMERCTVRLCGFRHISTSGFVVGASRASFFSPFLQSLAPDIAFLDH